jgi:hypothetical protein
MAAAAVIGAAVLAGTLLATLGTTPSASASVTLQSLGGVPFLGNLPKDAVSLGSVNWSKVPQLVSAVSHGTVVGYVRKADVRQTHRLVGPLQGPIPSCGTGGLDVYTADRRLIGHIYPDAGYTPLGVAPNCPPQSAAAPVAPPGPSPVDGGGSGSAPYSAVVPVPSVRGETLDQAERTLHDGGFSVMVVSVASPGAAPGTVVAEAPIAGSRLARGSEVTISVAS